MPSFPLTGHIHPEVSSPPDFFIFNPTFPHHDASALRRYPLGKICPKQTFLKQ